MVEKYTFIENAVKHPLYSAWSHMKSPCNKKNHRYWERYGAKGIKVCDEWENDFKAFYDWGISSGGWKNGLSLQRINKDLNFSPENCKFEKRQIKNTKPVKQTEFEAFGETKTLKEWSQDPRCVVSKLTLKNRITRYGWDAEESLTAPVWKYACLGNQRPSRF